MLSEFLEFLDERLHSSQEKLEFNILTSLNETEKECLDWGDQRYRICWAILQTLDQRTKVRERITQVKILCYKDCLCVIYSKIETLYI